ncbi:MAG: deoxyribodipyrimidine photolyase, partial [Planctomycetota bacterium]
HFMQKLEDMPDLDRRNMHSGYDGLRDTDPARLEAWCKGETGCWGVDVVSGALLYGGRGV